MFYPSLRFWFATRRSYVSDPVLPKSEHQHGLCEQGGHLKLLGLTVRIPGEWTQAQVVSEFHITLKRAPHAFVDPPLGRSPLCRKLVRSTDKTTPKIVRETVVQLTTRCRSNLRDRCGSCRRSRTPALLTSGRMVSRGSPKESHKVNTHLNEPLLLSPIIFQDVHALRGLATRVDPTSGTRLLCKDGALYDVYSRGAALWQQCEDRVRTV